MDGALATNDNNVAERNNLYIYTHDMKLHDRWLCICAASEPGALHIPNVSRTKS